MTCSFPLMHAYRDLLVWVGSHEHMRAGMNARACFVLVAIRAQGLTSYPLGVQFQVANCRPAQVRTARYTNIRHNVVNHLDTALHVKTHTGENTYQCYALFK